VATHVLALLLRASLQCSCYVETALALLQCHCMLRSWCCSVHAARANLYVCLLVIVLDFYQYTVILHNVQSSHQGKSSVTGVTCIYPYIILTVYPCTLCTAFAFLCYYLRQPLTDATYNQIREGSLLSAVVPVRCGVLLCCCVLTVQ
jgi:hypothetical protein